MKTVALDCSILSDRKQLHQALAAALAFPDWYGNNLDALLDCLTDLCEPTVLQLKNWQQITSALGAYGDAFLETLQDAAVENTLFSFQIL